MAPIRNTRVLLKQHIEDGYPVSGETIVTDHSQTIDLETVTLDGGFLGKVLCLSIDPYMRGRMRNVNKLTYMPPFEPGKPLRNSGVVKVLRSEDPNYTPGDYLIAGLEFCEYVVVPHGQPIYRKITEFKELGIPWSVFTGVLGMPGRTAFHGWREIANAKRGETIYVSTAAGPVGATVVQLAKAAGLKVIASAGHPVKLEFLRKIDADVVFNYKETDLGEVLTEHGPVDIYWDHVGNEMLETTLEHMNKFGRVVVCGAIASYNSAPHPIRTLNHVLTRQLTLQGFIVTDLDPKYKAEFYATIPKLVSEGKMKYSETVVRSLDEAGQLIVDVLKGNNLGKAVIVLADD